MKIIVSLILSLTVLGSINAQNNKGKIALEIINANIGVYGTTYVTRSTGVQKFGSEYGFMTQVYFPFQWSIDYKQNYSDSTEYVGEYNNRLFLIRLLAIFSITQQGNNFTGLSVQFSWFLFKWIYLDFATGVIWVEAKEGASDGLAPGFNLNQTLSLSKELSNHFTFSFGINHLSDAHIFNSDANQDSIFLGVKYIF